MNEPIWMDANDATIIHQIQLAEHGGPSGVRDMGMLESALGRPQNLWFYSETPVTLMRLAAAYAFGISSNHPFVDGNKRTAMVVSFAFLDTNGFALTATQEDAYRTILALAAGELSEQQLADWFEQNTAPM